MTTVPAHTLSKETLKSVEELGAILKPIYLRMKKEGYEIVDGKLTKHE